MTDRQARDKVGNQLFQIVKLTSGEAGVDGGLVSSSNGLPVSIAQNDHNFKTSTDTDFVTGDSPAIIDMNTALGENAKDVAVLNDGPGNFTIAISNDGISYGDEHTMKSGEVIEFDTISVDSLRVTWVADSAYRVVYI